MQWGRHNVLDCSCSLSPVSCDGWETPWKQLSPKTMKMLSVCAFLHLKMYFFYLFSFKTACMLGVIPQLIKLFKAKRAGGENLAEDPKRKLSQHHPRQGWTRAGNHTPCWALQVGNACQTHYMMPQVKDASQQSSPCLTATNNEWMPNPTTSMNLTWWVQLKPYEVFHHYTEDEVW